MDSFVFNGYKNSLLTGALTDVDKWTFYLVNKHFADDLADILPRIDTKSQLERFIFANDPTIERKGQAMGKYLSPFTPVRYTYKVATTTLNSERPSYVDLDNWSEFDKKYPNQIHLYHWFFVPGGPFYRLYDTDELDVNGNPIKKPRGFYYVETAEELRWCAEKVNGTVNGNKSDVYNNKINIVLGDNIGYGNALENQYKQIDFCIGSDVDRPFEGIFFGNGYAIQNIELICNGNSTGIIGYLGHEGVINTIRVKGHNLLRCNNKLSITHMVNDACDINAGFLCGKNNGMISDVHFIGKVIFVDFIPGVYPVSNKTDDGGNAFDNVEANPYYPDYLCINSIANIVPYIGYFNEGVFGTWAYSAGSRQFYPGEKFDECNKGYWKCNDLYQGHTSTDVKKENNLTNYYPYDNYGCGEWAYPEKTNMSAKEYESVTGHTLFYAIDTMFATQHLVADALGDWSTNLSLFKYSNSSADANSIVTSNWEIQSTQYLDKPMKMHQFNRVAYNTGLLVGCNEGSIANIAMNASAVTSGTYVGFLGGIAGKQAVNGFRYFTNVCVNLTAMDSNELKRNYYVSDDGDDFTVQDTNEANIVQFVTDLFGTTQTKSILKDRQTIVAGGPTDTVNTSDDYHRKLGVGGTREDGCFDWGDSSIIRMNINGYSGAVSGQLEHIFDIPESAYRGIMANYNEWVDPRIEPHQKYAPAYSLKNVLLENSAYSGSVTAYAGNYEAYSGLKLEKTSEMALTNYEILDKRTGATYAGNHPKAVGIVYEFGRFGHEGSLTNDIKDPYSKDSNNEAVTDDNKIQIRDANRIAGGNGYDYTTYTDFAVYAVDRENKDFWRLRNSIKIIFDKLGTTQGKELYIYNCSIGNLIIKSKDSSYSVPNSYERRTYNLNGIYGYNCYNYETYNIVGAKDVVLSMCCLNGTKYQYYTLTIPEILNSDENIGGTKFTNKASNQFFIANYENPGANKPVVSYLNEYYTMDGCSNYKIELKSIKNIGALFGSLVLGTYSYMSNVSAYLHNMHNTRFLHYTNHRTWEAGQITTLGNVVNISAFDVSAASASDNFFNDENLIKICKRNGYFETSANPGQEPVYVKSKTLSGTTYGYFSDVNGFKLVGGMRVGLYENHLMYSYPSYSHPDLHDYSFDNRFAPFAAVCEYNSSNISDKYTLNDTALHRYIEMTDINCVYTESYGYDDTPTQYRHYGPMALARDMLYTRDTPFANGVNMLAPTYAFGIALPFIAEIKPTYMATPSILQSPLSNIDNYGDTAESAVYKRVGLFTVDQTVASPINDPNYWSINLCVDLPGIAGVIDRNETVAQNVKLNGFELNNNDYSYERGKTVGNLLDHLFNMSEVKINKLYYGYINTATNSFVYGEGYGRMITNYSEVSNTSRLGFDAQTANDADPGVSIYTQNKVLAPDMYFGSDLVLNQTLPYASGYYNSPDDMYIVKNVYNPYSIGEYHQYFTPVTTTAISNQTLATEPFKYNGVNTNVTLMSDKVRSEQYGWFWSGIKGNMKKSDQADRYEGIDKFKYNFVKERLNTTATYFSHDVHLDEINNHYGFWFTDSLKDTISYKNKNILKYFNGDDDEVRYDGTTLHLGAMFSEKSILQSLKTERVITAASGIICDDLEGLYVVDSNNNNVMYIDIGMGECDGSQSWSMTCSADGVEGQGLLLGIE